MPIIGICCHLHVIHFACDLYRPGNNTRGVPTTELPTARLNRLIFHAGVVVAVAEVAAAWDEVVLLCHAFGVLHPLGSQAS
jgi:DNA replicative helicase MCM subunit Mcm2 (Cdc46/Mcm family)